MTSSLPKVSTAVATICLMSASLDTSHFTAMAFGASGNCCWMSSTARFAASSLMSAATTCAPSLAKTSDVSRPMPLRVGPGSAGEGASGCGRVCGRTFRRR